MREMTGCVEWQGARNRHGYGVVGVADKTWLAHRFAYRLEHGPIADGMVVRHLCHNPPCINPDHLERGTQADNIQDMVDAGRTAIGQRHSQAKLTEAQAIAIKADRRPSSVVARDYNVKPRQVRRIRRGESWSHLA